MAKVSYANLKLKTNTSVKTFSFEGQEIEVKQYLPTEDKYDLIMITLQNSRENNIFNSFKVDLYFHLNIIYLYTNLSFTEKQKENEYKLYDAIVSSGLLSLILEQIPENEYNFLLDHLGEIRKSLTEFNLSASAMVQSIVNDLPSNARAAAEIVDSFDKNKYQEVIEFAKAANGGRPIQ